MSSECVSCGATAPSGTDCDHGARRLRHALRELLEVLDDMDKPTSLHALPWDERARRRQAALLALAGVSP